VHEDKLPNPVMSGCGTNACSHSWHLSFIRQSCEMQPSVRESLSCGKSIPNRFAT